MFFKRKEKLKHRGLYAITQGKHLGDFYVYWGQTIEGDYEFIQLPDFQYIKLDEKTVEDGLKNKIMDYITILKKDAYNHIVAEFQGRK